MFSPKKLDDYIGQTNVKKQVETSVRASIALNKAFPHTLITGPRGTGKTTLARIIAKELGVGIVVTTPAALRTNEDLFRLFNSNLVPDEPVIIFIDEVHRLPENIQEDLYLPMENGLFVRRGLGKNSYRMSPFTIVAATTIPGKMTEPLRDRFGLSLHMDKYNQDEITEMLAKVCAQDNVSILPDAVIEVAKRGRNNPRVSKNLLDRCIELSRVEGHTFVDVSDVEKAFDMMSVDETGLGLVDRRYLVYLYEMGRPVGLASLEVMLDLDRLSIQSTIEPYLIERGLVTLTPKGRALTKEGSDWVEENVKGNNTGMQAL